MIVTVLSTVEQKVEDGGWASSCERSIGKLNELALPKLRLSDSYWLNGTKSWSAERSVKEVIDNYKAGLTGVGRGNCDVGNSGGGNLALYEGAMGA